MSSLGSILAEQEGISKARVFLSRSRVTYRGPNTYRSKRTDALRTEHQAPPAPPPETACEICLEVNDLVSPSSRCTHEPMICASCLGAYVIHAVRVDGLTRVVCLALGCREELGYEEVVKGVGGDVECLDQYHALLAQKEMESHPDFRWCMNPECGQGQVHKEGGPMITCDYCHMRSCFFHRVPWHQDLTCEQYTEVHANYANEMYLANHAKRCPKPTCKFPIEKVSGCDHMTCRCGHHFCWSCLADYGRHNPGCRNYVRVTTNPNPIPVAPPPVRPPRLIRRRRPPPATFRGRARAAVRGLRTGLGRLISSVRRLPSRAN